MKISDIGEFGFIDAIKEDTIYNPQPVVIGIGDDGAVYKTSADKEQIVVIDTMVENSHFIIGKTATWYDVGYKAVASNLSDIAAMGGIPTHIVLSTAIAPSMDVEDLKSMYQGIKDICQKYRINILGGDTVMSKEGMVITVTALGEIETGKALRRSGAKPGDIVAVSHTVGNSSGGLDVLLSNVDGYPQLRKAHRLPEPQIELGRLLVKHHCHSLNDISDGLASESNEIAKAGHVDILLERDCIPRSEELQKWSREQSKNSWKYVFSGGEDYELVFTMTAADFAALQKEYPDVTKIGSVREGEGKVYLSCDGQETILSATGWAHF
jgi:thiamine-monophosphate kinase